MIGPLDAVFRIWESARSPIARSDRRLLSENSTLGLVMPRFRIRVEATVRDARLMRAETWSRNWSPTPPNSAEPLGRDFVLLGQIRLYRQVPARLIIRPSVEGSSPSRPVRPSLSWQGGAGAYAKIWLCGCRLRLPSASLAYARHLISSPRFADGLRSSQAQRRCVQTIERRSLGSCRI